MEKTATRNHKRYLRKDVAYRAGPITDKSNGVALVGLPSSFELSKIQQKIIYLVWKGETNKQIGSEVEITESVVKDNLRDLYKKIGISNRVEFALWIDTYIATSDKVQEYKCDTPIYLTKRERDILKIFVKLNGGIKRISDSCHVTKRDVKHHLGNIYQKVGIKKKNKAVRLAVWLKQYKGVLTYEPIYNILRGAVFNREDLTEMGLVNFSLIDLPDALKLSSGQKRIVCFIWQGKKNKEIGFEIGLGEQTVKNYLRDIFDEVGVFSRGELALWADEHIDSLSKIQINKIESTVVFTEMEKRVLREFLKGISSEEISKSFGIKYKTVKSHLNRVYKKLRVRHGAKAVKVIIWLKQNPQVLEDNLENGAV
jgi:DNA-binding NarL/FixJ family response regulator